MIKSGEPTRPQVDYNIIFSYKMTQRIIFSDQKYDSSHRKNNTKPKLWFSIHFVSKKSSELYVYVYTILYVCECVLSTKDAGVATHHDSQDGGLDCWVLLSTY